MESKYTGYVQKEHPEISYAYFTFHFYSTQEELLIFMELCSEGTLESLVELSGGLHEGLARRFTAQLLSGVEELHKHGIVHRDIKTANIFLVDGGNSLKLGDFGSAVKIQAHTTVPGELQGYVGTQGMSQVNFCLALRDTAIFYWVSYLL